MTPSVVKIIAAACVTFVALTATSPAVANTAAWSSLDKERGVVVLMRHALAPGGGDPAGFTLGNCRTQRNLSREGRQQARRIGEQIRASGVDVAAVASSPWCRAKDTAALLNVGPVRTLSYLGSTFTAPQTVAEKRERQTRRLLESHRGKKGLLILVGHYANIMDLTGLTTDSGEAVAVRIDARGDIDVIRRIPAS